MASWCRCREGVLRRAVALGGLLLSVFAVHCGEGSSSADSALGGTRAVLVDLPNGGEGGAAGSTLLAGFGGSAGQLMAQDLFLIAPSFQGNDQMESPLVGVVRFETRARVGGTMTVSGGGEEWQIPLEPATSFDVSVLGILPQTSYRIELVLQAGRTSWQVPPLAWTSPALPEDFPRFEVTLAEASRMEPGMTLFAPRLRDGRRPPLVVVDRFGQVRWFYWNETWPAEDARVLPEGHLLLNSRGCAVRELDWRGRLIAAFHATHSPVRCPAEAGSVPVAVDRFHHEVSRPEGLDGNYLSLSSELRVLDGFPSSEEVESAATVTAEVVGAVIVEFSSKGDLVRSTSMMDVVDPYRIGRDSLSNASLAQNYGPEAKDWDHANSVIYDPSSDAYLVSLRHQDAIVKVSRASGELLWILGSPQNWRSPYSAKLLDPVGALAWPFHQHALELNPLGLALYDNGNHRAGAYEPRQQEWSRVVVFEVDDRARTVRQVWSHGEPEGPARFFSGLMGDADWQAETGNFLYVNGELGEIVEVTPAGEEVFHLRASDSRNGSVVPIYRAERISDLRLP